MTFADVARRAARVATGRLGWSPAVFWDATPAELRLALEGMMGVEEPAAVATRADLARLEAMFPDG